MSEDSISNQYPAVTDEVAKMLGLKQSHDESVHDSSGHPADLPTVSEAHATEHVSEHAATSEVHVDEDEHVKVQPRIVKILKGLFPYLAVFAVGLFLYYFFFSNVNIGVLLPSLPKQPASVQETAIEQLESQDKTAYNSWINSYYFDVTDPSIIDPNTDNSGNGLSNFQKFLLNLNPKAYDTLGLGMSDSQALADGINPLTGGPLTDEQKSIISQYIDMEVVMNRLTLAQVQETAPTSGVASNYGAGSVVPVPVTTTVTNTATNTNSANIQLAPSSAPSTPSLSDAVDINTNIPGEISIPDLKISAPIIWSNSPNDFETDLEQGVIHYPGTALPGQIGTTYIAGHSSNYVWAKGNYNHVFTTLGNLKDDASFTITVTSTSGQKITFDYVVVSRQEYSPTDPAQVANTGKSLIALSTCWPVNTTAKRLVVYGQLTQVEQ